MAQSADIIIDRLKKLLNLPSDKALCEVLDIKPNTLSTWKRRETLDFNKVIALCNKHELNLNYVFFGEESDTFSVTEEKVPPPAVMSKFEGSEIHNIQLVNTNRNIILFKADKDSLPLVKKGTLVVGQKIQKNKIRQETPYIITFTNNACTIDEFYACEKEANCFRLKYKTIADIDTIIPDTDISAIWQLVDTVQ
ncbi:helix-turn-helix domain-containing protein [Luteirhabdus pelagi]|uniref:helix-turn-helix domain-containing protein n=1 Tax=Luteirhabdus pelagi TaxID=2792783 RepID=UPI00193A568C|nr:helix-turn-helix domain-containing protein [Luteirhabdus pelagi]